MTSFRGRLATSQLALFAALCAAACQGDSATAPDAGKSSLQIAAVSATYVEGTVGEAVSVVPAVRVTDRSGHPVSGTQVTFTPWVRSDSVVSVTNPTAVTNAQGIATPGSWSLGGKAGVQELEASILGAHVADPDSGAGRVVIFSASAASAAPAAIAITSGDGQMGMPGEAISPPRVRVTDRFGNAVDGVTVTFAVTSGGGTLAQTSIQTSSGFASPGTWTLGASPGVNSVAATVPGLSPANFSARALDAGAVTWYDLLSPLPAGVVSSSIALYQNDGVFESKTVAYNPGDGAGPDPYTVRGTYTLAGTKLVLTYSAGTTAEGTLVGDTLSLAPVIPSWAVQVPAQLTFIRRH